MGMLGRGGMYSVSAHTYVRNGTLLSSRAVATFSYLSGAPC
jgi:hypothetical protein